MYKVIFYIEGCEYSTFFKFWLGAILFCGRLSLINLNGFIEKVRG